MRDVLTPLIERLEHSPVALARVVATTGSAPRLAGTAMVVTAEGEVIGSLSGGCVESAVIESAADVLSTGCAVVERFGYADPDGIAVGLTCGGEVEVFIERLDGDRLDDLRRIRAAADAGTPLAWATTLTATPRWHLASRPGQGPWLRLDRDVDDLLATGRSGIIGVDDCDDPGQAGSRPRTFVQTFAPPARLILVGANDFVRALSALGADLGYRVTVVDARAVFATAARFPAAHEVVIEWPDRYLSAQIADGGVDESTVVCVMTHEAKFDVPTLRVALGSTIGFVGALGSRRTVADRTTRLRQAGVTAEQLGRLRSPLGLDLGGHTPTEVAVSIAAQLIAARHDASGVALVRRRGPIHRR
ncbi:XdhC/CoxI family protein [Gordonia sp. VNQ95]|jgi:xanthine dehydrogenase accessory factor|uniref:XdhC family protein n=1 Tax=Gordonia TaxID=2053 RepID=UPI0032B462E3